MLPLRSVLAAKFWNEEVESTRSLEAVVQTLPHEPPPPGLLRASKISRSQQLLLLQQFMRLPCTPSYVQESGLVLDRVLASAGTSNWWTTVTGRFRAQRFWQQEPAPTSSRDRLKRLFDGSLYALCARAHLKLANDLTVTATSELDSLGQLFNAFRDGNPRGVPWRGRLSIRKKLQRHDVVGEGAWHQQLVDKDACYWDIPQAVSLDFHSFGSKSGLRYRLGVHHSAGIPQSTCLTPDVVRPVPAAAVPGSRAQVAASYEKVFHIWKDQETTSGRRRRKPYNLFAARPHVSLSAIVGGLAGAQLTQPPEHLPVAPGHTAAPLSADLFASLGFSAQWGLFRRPLFDHTKVGVRVDVGSAAALAACRLPSSSASGDLATAHAHDDGRNPSLALTLHQQVVGPVRARVDSRFTLDPALTAGIQMQDLTYGVDCSLEPSGAAKFVMWYSPSRREGMAEIRLLEK